MNQKKLRRDMKISSGWEHKGFFKGTRGFGGGEDLRQRIF